MADTLQIKSTHPETQGPFVVIDAEQFDPERHELWMGEDAPPAAPVDPAPAKKRKA